MLTKDIIHVADMIWGGELKEIFRTLASVLKSETGTHHYQVDVKFKEAQSIDEMVSQLSETALGNAPEDYTYSFKGLRSPAELRQLVHICRALIRKGVLYDADIRIEYVGTIADQFEDLDRLASDWQEESRISGLAQQQIEFLDQQAKEEEEDEEVADTAPVAKGGSAGSATATKAKSTSRWDKIGDKVAYLDDARLTIADVYDTAISYPDYEDIALLLDLSPPIFLQETAKKGLREGYFARMTGGKFHVSMNWIEAADLNPRNVFHNIAHEVGGHLAYGTTVAHKVSREVIQQLDPDAREKLIGKREADKGYSPEYRKAFIYPETEIFAELRERKYREAEYLGGYEIPAALLRKGLTDSPDRNIADLLEKIQENWHPDVGRAMLISILDKAVADSEIREEDVRLFRGLVSKIMKYEIEPPPSTSAADQPR